MRNSIKIQEYSNSGRIEKHLVLMRENVKITQQRRGGNEEEEMHSTGKRRNCKNGKMSS